jgi:hypothetical protein
MKTFTGWQYLLIDVANNYCLDLDKTEFEPRIAWAEKHLDKLEAMAENEEWKEKPLYLKAVQSVRRAQRGEPMGHLVGMDAANSGMQIMSVMTGCITGADATGLVDPEVRADAYTRCTAVMSRILGSAVTVVRKVVKSAAMKGLYGSKKEPKKAFGEDTPELHAFYDAMYEVAPGACQLLQILLDSWQPYARQHAYQLPDGFEVKTKVRQRVEADIEVDELDHSTFKYVYYENEGEESGVKNAANIIHSIDAYILRSLIRRCDYDYEHFDSVSTLIEVELLDRSLTGRTVAKPREFNAAYPNELYYYKAQFARSGHADIVIVPYLDDYGLMELDTDHLIELNRIINTMLVHSPFEVVTIHDDFKCHPNNVNHMRFHYREILAELADSNLMEDILTQLHGVQGCTFKKLSSNLSTYIRQSNYAIC